MPCDTQLAPGVTPEQRLRDVAAALARLELALAQGQARVRIAPNGALAFVDWNDRAGVTDLCAYRALATASSSPLRLALQRAETLAGRKLNPQALAAGWHSHDEGATWSHH